MFLFESLGVPRNSLEPVGLVVESALLAVLRLSRVPGAGLRLPLCSGRVGWCGSQ